MNKYFVDVSTLDDNNIGIPDFQSRTNNEISNIEFTENDIIDILTSLKSNKATGMDSNSISHNMLKNTALSVCVPLYKLFKLSIQKSVFPREWKKAKVMPLYKKGDAHQPSNYRLIALLSSVGKVFERVIH